MARFRVGVSLSLLLLPFVLGASAQQRRRSSAMPTSAPQRDPAALATITQALTAMALQTGTTISTAVLTGSVSAAPGSQDPAGTFTSTVEFNSTGYEVRNELVSNGVTSVFVSGHGTPGTWFGTRQPWKMSGHVTMIAAPSQLPILELINALTNPVYQVTQAASAQIGLVSAVHIQISNETDSITHAVTLQDWYFNPVTGLPVRWQFLVPDTFNAGHSIWTGTKDFANYQVMGGLLLPSQITYSRDGQPASIATVSSVQLNVTVTESQFDLP
jgi:hypothetical protein